MIVRTFHWHCLACAHHASAMTERALIAALDLHQSYAHSGAPKTVRPC